MKYYVLTILILLTFSCKKDIGDNIIYKDILSQLILQNKILSLNVPFAPYFRDNKDDEEIARLKEQIFYLNDRQVRIENFLTRKHKVLILDHLLAVNPESFTKHYIGTSEITYDTTWIGNVDYEIKTKYRPIKINNLNLNISFFSTYFIDHVPKPDTSFYHKREDINSDIFYLQLSEIILNKNGNKGIFYYAISTDGNLNGYMKYCYIEKIKNNWMIIEK
ncbi:MAG: hypothetical protein Q8928_04390 [Bacteroidota bacterium]|nr:hypothetical protein [Bacteroidota bacterium]